MFKIGPPLLAGLLSLNGFTIDFGVVTGPFDSGRIQIPGTVDGVHKTFFFDTGASFTSLRCTEALSSYPKIGTIRHASAAGVVRELDKIEVRQVNFGELVLEDYPVARYANGASDPDTVGLDVFQNGSFEVNFGNRTLTLNPENPASSSPILTLNGGIRIPVEVNHQTIEAIWDTGAGLTAIDKKFLEENSEFFRFIRELPEGRDATGAPVTAELFELSEIYVEGQKLEELNVLAIDFSAIHRLISPDIKLVLGFNIVSRGDWWFDLEKMTWHFEPI